MSVVKIVDHPLIQHKISLMRDRNTRLLQNRRNLDSMRSQMASSEEHSGILTSCGDLMELPMRTLEMV